MQAAFLQYLFSSFLPYQMDAWVAPQHAQGALTIIAPPTEITLGATAKVGYFG